MSRIALSSPSKSRFWIPVWLAGPWGIVGLASILYAVVFLFWTYFHWGGEENITLIGDLSVLPPMLLASLMGWRVAAQSTLTQRVQRAWLFIGLSIFMNFIGNALWTYLENVLHVQPFPSIADIFYLAAYPLMLWGLLMLPVSPHNRREQLVFWFDLIIVFTTASTVVGYFLIIPTANVNNSDLLSQILATAYPVWSLILLGGVMALLLRKKADPNIRDVLLFLLIGIGFFLMSDLTFGYASLAGTYVVGGWIDIGWQIAQVFLVLAALRQMYLAPTEASEPRRLRLLEALAKMLPLLSVILSYGLVLFAMLVNFDSTTEWLLISAALLTMFLIIRQILSPGFVNLSLRAKLILTFLLVCVFSVGLVTFFTYLNLRSNLELTVGLNLQAQAEIRSQIVSNLIGKQIDVLEGFVLNEELEDQARDANTGYIGDLATIQTQLQRQDLAWKTAKDADPLVQNVLKSITASELHEFLLNFPGYTDVLVTDKYGATIGATVRPQRYLQTDQAWWQATYDDGQGKIYVGQPTPNPATGTSNMIIAMPIRRVHGSELVGIIRVLYNTDDISALLSRSHGGVTSDLLLPNGKILDSAGNIVSLEPRLVSLLRTTANTNYTQMSWEGTLQLVSQARVISPNPADTHIFEDLDWILIDHQHPQDALAPVNAARRTALLTIFVVLIVTTGVAVSLAQLVVAPIARLTGVAKQIAKGDFSTKAQVESQDEIGVLASTFNAMLDALKQARLELEESEALYRSLVDYSPDMIAVESQGRFLFINPAGVELLGAKSTDNLIGHPILDMFLKQDWETVQAGIRDSQGLRKLNPSFHPKVHRLDGTSFEAEFQAIPITYAGKPAIQYVMRDITDRKMAQEKIHQLLAQVSRQRNELEIRVQERTAELSSLNARLQNELLERQRLVQSLRDHERQLAQAVTLARIAYWELDLKKLEFTFNDQFYNVLRTTAQKVGGYFIPAERFLQQCVHPADADYIRERIRSALSPTSSTGQLEYRCFCGDGQIQYVFLEYQIAFDEWGQATRVFGAHMDITERQRLVESLRESEEQFRLLFEASPDAIVLVDPNHPTVSWPIVDCNEAACTMNGYMREELLGKSIDLLNAIPHSSNEREEYAQAIREKGILHYEAVHRHKTGCHFPVEVSTSIITFAGRDLILGIDRDITERKRAEEALRLSEEKYRNIFENVQDVFYTTDDQGQIVTISPSVERHTGYRPEELIGQHIRNFLMNEADYERLDQAVATHDMLNDYEMVMKRKDGSLIQVSVTARSIFDENGNAVSTQGVLRDITERKQAEEALSQAKDAAEESRRVAEAASRAKSEFLSRMSHELRTPMNAILGFAQLLEMSRKEQLSPTQKERVHQIVKGGQHLLELINEILDISRIEANRLQISPEPVSIRESIQEVVDLTVPLAVKRHIQIVTKLGSMEHNPFVMADRQRLKQVLLNILGNAVKYNYDDGTVIITCHQTQSGHWRISIADSGPGIPKEQQNRLFKPFERLVTDQSGIEGTGLGLTLAKRLIELMRGQIGVESMLGKGSTFWIELPSAESPVERLHHLGGTGELPVLSCMAHTILYVEDNVANFELIKQVLADYSQIELLWAPDFKSGVETARQHHPDLILLDVHLGGQDGADVLQQLQQDETAGTPVIVVSADATPRQVERLLTFGAYAYLTKPLDVKDFLRLLEELLGEKER